MPTYGTLELDPVRHAAFQDRLTRLREQWVEQVTTLVREAEDWAVAAKDAHRWTVEQETHEIEEEVVGGAYVVPGLRVSGGEGEIRLEPVARRPPRRRAGGPICMAEPVPYYAAPQKWCLGRPHRVRAGLASAVGPRDVPNSGRWTAPRRISHVHVEQLSAVFDEYIEVHEAVTQRLRDPSHTGYRDLQRAERNLETTYIVRLFVEFEGILRLVLLTQRPASARLTRGVQPD